MIKLGMIGCGNIGRFVIKNLNREEFKALSLRVISDLPAMENSLRSLAEMVKCDYTTDPLTLIDRGLDAVLEAANRCACLAFARGGAKVGLVDIGLHGAGQTLMEIRAAGKEATIFECDVSDPTSVKTIVDRAVSELGWIDIVVNCAGVREICSFLELPFEEWKRVIDINLTDTFLCAQRVAQTMVKRGKAELSSISPPCKV
jgi:hypothetical protein